MSAQKFAVPPRLLRGLNRTSPITRLALEIDRDLIAIDRALFAFAAGEIRAGRPEISLGAACRALWRCDNAVRDAFRRLRWRGYLRAADRDAGPEATRFRLGMPFEVRWGAPIPRRPKLAEIMPSGMVPLPERTLIDPIDELEVRVVRLGATMAHANALLDIAIARRSGRSA